MKLVDTPPDYPMRKSEMDGFDFVGMVDRSRRPSTLATGKFQLTRHRMRSKKTFSDPNQLFI